MGIVKPRRWQMRVMVVVMVMLACVEVYAGVVVDFEGGESLQKFEISGSAEIDAALCMPVLERLSWMPAAVQS